MLKVRCEVYYPEATQVLVRVIDWDDYDQKREFARRCDWAIRNGGKVTTMATDEPVGRI